MIVSPIDTPVIGIAIGGLLAVVAVIGAILLVTYNGLGQRVVTRIAPRTAGVAPLLSLGRTERTVLFETESADEPWSPNRLPVEPDDGVFYTDEERVLRLLIVNGGRMKQSAIVRETEWSSAKVSRLLHRMEERSDVSRVPSGRSKVVYLGHYRTGDAEPHDTV